MNMYVGNVKKPLPYYKKWILQKKILFVQNVAQKMSGKNSLYLVVA